MKKIYLIFIILMIIIFIWNLIDILSSNLLFSYIYSYDEYRRLHHNNILGNIVIIHSQGIPLLGLIISLVNIIFALKLILIKYKFKNTKKIYFIGSILYLLISISVFILNYVLLMEIKESCTV